VITVLAAKASLAVLASVAVLASMTVLAFMTFYTEIGDGEVIEEELTEYRFYTASRIFYYTDHTTDAPQVGYSFRWCGCAVVEHGAPEPTR
jgi:hypothetical protein